MIENAERNPDGTITVDGKRYVLAYCKKDIREYCREHRCWAAKDDTDGSWYSYREKPTLERRSWSGHGIQFFPAEAFYFPAVPWDKSLMAPDGRLILVEPKPEKAKKTVKVQLGHWYRRKHPRSGHVLDHMAGKAVVLQRSEVSICPCTAEYDNVSVYIVPNIAAVWPIDDLYEVQAPKAKKWKPTRGEAILVWDEEGESRIPAIVEYFARYCPDEGYPVSTYSTTCYGTMGHVWSHMRKFDPALVGVPRKDWPKAAEGDEI